MKGLVSYIAFLSLLLTASGCQNSGSQNLQTSTGKIFGGNKVYYSAWKNVVALTTKKRGQFCTGTLISKDTVITAAHCVDGKENLERDLKIYFGTGKDSRYVGSHSVKKIKYHPQFNKSTLNSDVAYIVLKYPVRGYTGDIVPIISKEEFSKIKVGDQVKLVGFGKREDKKAGTKYQVDVKFIEDLGTELSAGDDGKDSCNGDSGGPIFYQNERGKWFQIGITSRGAMKSPKSCGLKGIYTKAAYGQKWIKADKVAERAISLFKNRFYTDAKETFLKAQAIEENLSTINYYLAKIHEVENEVDLAIKEYNKALEKNPNYFEASFNIGKIFLKKNMTQKAKESLLNALKERPEHLETFDYLFRLTDDKSNLYLKHGIFTLNKSDIPDDLKGVNKALKLFEKAILKNKYNGKAYAWLANTLGLLKNPKVVQILDLYKKSIDLGVTPGKLVGEDNIPSIFYGITSNNTEILDFLILNGTELSYKYKEKYDLLDICFLEKKEKSFEYILNYPGLPISHKNLTEKLTEYYRQGKLKFVKILINSGLSITDVAIDKNEKLKLANDWNNYYTYNDWLYYLIVHDKDLKGLKVR